MADAAAKRGAGLGRWVFLLLGALLLMVALAAKGTEKFAPPEGMTQTASGLSYKVLRAAEGPRPQASDFVLVHYEGRLMDGTVFDSSYERGEPAAFPVAGVVPGFAEGLQLMSKGSKFRLIIPPQLGYGAEARGPIPANSMLDFQVELLEIAPPQ